MLMLNLSFLMYCDTVFVNFLSLLCPLLYFFCSDLSDVMHKVHETFIALAAQLHELHEAVKVR